MPPACSPAPRPLPWARLAIAAAALLWLAAVALPTTSSGAGAALTGHALADLIGSGALGSVAPRWLGPTWYLMPLGGAIVLLAAAIPDRRLTAWSGLAAAGVASGAALLSTALVTDLRVDRFGLGSWCAVGGACLALAGIAATAAARQRPGSTDALQ